MQKKYYTLLLIFLAIYITLSWITPVKEAVLDHYHITAVQLKLISLSLIIPVAAIWFIAFYGFINFKSYSQIIKDEVDGKGLDKIASGLSILAMGMVVTSILSAATSYWTATHPEHIPAGVIVRNLVSVVIAVSAYSLMYKGATILRNTTKTRENSVRRIAFYITYAAFALGYAYLTLNRDDKRIAATELRRGSYYLPDWLIIAAVVVPYLVAWLLGIVAVVNLGDYKHNVKGIIYKEVLAKLSMGIAVVVLAAIGVQILGFISESFLEASLQKILGIIYLLLAFIAAGYVLIAIGAKKLKKLEGI
jgi:hypothetical protein